MGSSSRAGRLIFNGASHRDSLASILMLSELLLCLLTAHLSFLVSLILLGKLFMLLTRPRLALNVPI
jgi:hypothetical protein